MCGKLVERESIWMEPQRFRSPFRQAMQLVRRATSRVAFVPRTRPCTLRSKQVATGRSGRLPREHGRRSSYGAGAPRAGSKLTLTLDPVIKPGKLQWSSTRRWIHRGTSCWKFRSDGARALDRGRGSSTARRLQRGAGCAHAALRQCGRGCLQQLQQAFCLGITKGSASERRMTCTKPRANDW